MCIEVKPPLVAGRIACGEHTKASCIISHRSIFNDVDKVRKAGFTRLCAEAEVDQDDFMVVSFSRV